jgi:hypothetical protein
VSDISSFGEAASAALASLETPQPSAEGTPSEVAQPDVNAAQTGSAPETPLEANIPSFTGSKHKVKIRGTEEEVDYDELVKGYSRQADYTRSKQELAEQARAIREMESQIKATQENLSKTFGSDPLLAQAAQVAQHYNVPFSQALNAVLQYQRSQEQAQATPTPGTPDEIASIAQARQIAAQEVAQMQRQVATMQEQIQQWTQQQIEAAKSDIQTSHKSQGYATEINSTLSEIFQQNPILGAVENMEDILRFKVYQADPATVEEAKDLFVKFASEQAEKLTRQFNEINKSRVVAKEKLTTAGIEPPGGAGVTPVPQDLKFGSKELRDAAASYIQQMTR